MTGLERRLCRLEARADREECPECGLVAGEPSAALEVLWHDEEDAAPSVPEWCSTCGEQTVYVVGWSDFEPADPGGGG